jgi:hypothetical protein
MAAHLTGREAEFADSLTRAHQGFLAQGDTREAVRCAFWLGFELLNNGESAQAGGWFARARRLLDDGELDCVEQGYTLCHPRSGWFMKGTQMRRVCSVVQAASIGERFRDIDLVTPPEWSRTRPDLPGTSRARRITLDEAMIAVTAGEISPSWSAVFTAVCSKPAARS